MGEHRADIRTPRGMIELQHSPIAPEEIREREALYGRMIWLLDGRRMVFGLNEFGLDGVARIERVDVSPRSGLAPPACRFGTGYGGARGRRSSRPRSGSFIDLGEEVLEVADKQASRKEGFLLLGRMERRDHFPNRAGLRRLDTTEEERVLSLLVRYLPKDNGRVQDRPGFHRNNKGPSRRWRESATGGATGALAHRLETCRARSVRVAQQWAPGGTRGGDVTAAPTPGDAPCALRGLGRSSDSSTSGVDVASAVPRRPERNLDTLNPSTLCLLTSFAFISFRST